MKRITLKRMELKNFKGVRSLEIDFGSDTSVYGRNGTGKTTIYDAFTWVLFNKDSRNKQDFQVATNDKDGNFIPRLEHEVSIVLDVDGITTKLTKRKADKWVTKRGTTTPKLEGWAMSYFINDVPAKDGEFKTFVSKICDYDTFKMVTMPGHFMTLDKDKRRAMLLDMAGGDISPKSIVGEDKDLEAVLNWLNGTNYEAENKHMKAEKSKLNKERGELETKIVTYNSNIRQDLPTLEEVQQQIADGEKMILEIDSQISDRTSSLKAAQQQNKERQEEILQANNEISELISKKIWDVQRHKDTLSFNIRGLEANIQGLQNTINNLKTLNEQQLKAYEEKSRIREQFIEQLKLINAETFRIAENETCCPTCGRAFEGDMLTERCEELKRQFYERKAQRLTDIQTKGKANSQLRDQAQHQSALYLKQIAEAKEKISELQAKVDAWRKESEKIEIPTEEYLTKNDTDVMAAVAKRDQLTQSAEAQLPIIDVSDLQNKQQEIRQKQGQLNQTLAEIKRNNADKEKVLQLEEELRTISASIAALEQKEDLIIQYLRKRATFLEPHVNKMFSMVKFKFLREQINEGIEEICEPYVDGSPYSTNLNNGGRINAGIDICTAIAKYYGIEAPIFVDNAEASNTFIPTETQIVKLIVSEDDQIRILTK